MYNMPDTRTNTNMYTNTHTEMKKDQNRMSMLSRLICSQHVRL
jgi:hypothetical protein